MDNPLRFGIIAGEKSGDNLGAGLMRAIQHKYPNCEFEGIGGPAMKALGFKSMYPMERLSVMGFIEPLGRLPELLRMQRQLKKHFTDNPPDAFIGIDSPGFNIRFEKSLRERNIKTVHYVSPSVWAYAEKRIKEIKQAVDLMLVLFPFEEAIYLANDVEVKVVGHPLADSISFEDNRDIARTSLGFNSSDTVIALMPGSRSNEIKRLGPVFIRTAKQLQLNRPGLKFVLPCASADGKAQVQSLLKIERGETLVKLVEGDAQDAIAASDLVLLASGTATLETMLLKRLMVVCYKLSPLTYAIASRMLKVPYVGLPNLLAGKLLVPEFMQNAVTEDNLCAEIERLLDDDPQRRKVLVRFEEIHREIAGNANERAADAILGFCQT
ncbi:MAG: lipid-A-disaccharide synthase [Gammaproteobacteria bacterium]|nr:lipid-A-disaccharide synthase [Gammaproteobacteria bacterium]